jgi:crotonobetainyl-CoA:carnitine CoA-transferase CaiB-like acyl-CoA transferase
VRNRIETQAPRPFAGLRVIELGQIYSGPYCGLMFAHLGADVIKVESPRGELLRFREDPGVESREFMMLNSSKRSLPIDLKTPQGIEIFLDVIDRTDVLIENFSIGVTDRLGIGPETLMERNPRLIYARGTGYGPEGALSGLSAMDITVQAIAGVISTTGFPDGKPVKTGPAIADFMAGIHLFAAAVTALYQREREGVGQMVQAAMYDSVVPSLASPMAAHQSGKGAPERVGNCHSGLSVAPYNVYSARDGYVAVFCVSNRHWRRLLTCMGQESVLAEPRFATPHSRAKNMAEVDELVEAWTSQRTRAEIAGILGEHGVPSAPVQTVSEVRRDEHLIANGMIQTVLHHGLGEVAVPGCPIRLDGPPPTARAAPALGADTHDVLAGLLGYDEERIRGLLESGATSAAHEMPSAPSATKVTTHGS